NTGNWFKAACPDNVAARPESLGGIYRIRRQGTAKVEDPRGAKLDWEKVAVRELIVLLADSRPVVRDRATAALARRGPQAIAALADAVQKGSPETKRTAIWALTRMDLPAARGAVRPALSDQNDSVRLIAIQSAGLHRDGDAAQRLGELVKAAAPPVRRAAAVALGRIGRGDAVASLLNAVCMDN